MAGSVGKPAVSLARLSLSAPLLAGVCLFCATLALWHGLARREREQQLQRTALVADTIAEQLRSKIVARTLPIEHLAARWSRRSQPTRAEWTPEADLFARAYSSYRAIAWISPDNRVRWFAPEEGNSTLEAFDYGAVPEARAALHASLRRHATVVSGIIDGRVFLVCAPMPPRAENEGVIAGLLRVRELLSPLSSTLPAGFSAAVFGGGRQLYPEHPAAIDRARAVERDIAFYGATWRLAVWPRMQSLLETRTRLPQLTLITGIALSLLAALGIRLADNSRRHASVLSQLNRDLLAEVGERKRIENELRRAKEILESIIAACPLAVVGVDSTGVVRTWNAAAESLFGWTAEERIGGASPIEDPHAPIRPAGTEHTRLIEGGIECKDGRMVQARMWGAVRHDGAGRFAGAVWLVEDQTERARMEERLRTAEKIEAVSRLAGGLAHDFNNLLGVIIGYGELVRGGLEEGHRLRPEVDEILAAANRAASITAQLLAFGRGQTMQLEEFAVNDFVRGMQSTLAGLLGGRISLRVSLAPAAGWVRADPAQLSHVLTTFALNSRDAMPAGGRVALETAQTRVEPAAAERLELAPGLYATIEMSDTGCGVDPEDQRHLFEPFYTTKRPGNGAGLGLSGALGILQQIGGTIEVASAPGQGTTFRLYLRAV